MIKYHPTPLQLQAMESVFQEKQYPDVTTLTTLSERIGLQTEKVCVSHFQFHPYSFCLCPNVYTTQGISWTMCLSSGWNDWHYSQSIYTIKDATRWASANTLFKLLTKHFEQLETIENSVTLKLLERVLNGADVFKGCDQ